MGILIPTSFPFIEFGLDVVALKIPRMRKQWIPDPLLSWGLGTRLVLNVNRDKYGSGIVY